MNRLKEFLILEFKGYKKEYERNQSINQKNEEFRSEMHV